VILLPMRDGLAAGRLPTCAHADAVYCVFPQNGRVMPVASPLQSTPYSRSALPPDPGGEAESIRKPKLISLNLNQLRSYEVPITRTVDQQQSDAATPGCLVKSGDGVNDLFRSSTAVSLAELIAVEIEHKEPNGR
jgi:hypothetical protein